MASRPALHPCMAQPMQQSHEVRRIDGRATRLGPSAIAGKSRYRTCDLAYYIDGFLWRICRRMAANRRCEQHPSKYFSFI